MKYFALDCSWSGSISSVQYCQWAASLHSVNQELPPSKIWSTMQEVGSGAFIENIFSLLVLSSLLRVSFMSIDSCSFQNFCKGLLNIIVMRFVTLLFIHEWIPDPWGLTSKAFNAMSVLKFLSKRGLSEWRTWHTNFIWSSTWQLTGFMLFHSRWCFCLWNVCARPGVKLINPWEMGPACKNAIISVAIALSFSVIWAKVSVGRCLLNMSMSLSLICEESTIWIALSLVLPTTIAISVENASKDKLKLGRGAFRKMLIALDYLLQLFTLRNLWVQCDALNNGDQWSIWLVRAHQVCPINPW